MAAVDAMSVIVGALAAGGVAGAKDVASAAVKDAYAGLRGLLVHRVSGTPQEAEVLNVLDTNQVEPAVWESQLRQALTATGVDDDAELLATAQRLLTLVDPASARSRKFHVDASQAKGVYIGDGGTQSNTFS
ncbi:hypothetical protein [Actinoplanes sp. NPDC051411]|uniref:hypothetical protein n=1 Tax=Actinoplanes sp. NPDC051411 TaxID=3155522 RepID=UPI0034153A58